MSGVEALARVLSNPADRTTAGGRRRAERILADPGPLLTALTEAGVLREEREPIACHGCGRTPCLARCRVNDDRRVRRRYVTEWETTDARP